MLAAAQWDPINVPKIMPWCTIAERGGETGFRLRFAGTAVCDFYGEEMTGQAIGNRMSPETRAFYFADLEEILRRPCGRLFTVQARSDTGRVALFETLSLPLADPDGHGFRMLNHQAIIDELEYGDPHSEFAMPERAFWVDLGEGVPDR